MERQKELAERKCGNVYKPKKKIMISNDLMKSPIQRMGKVSNISKREEATINKKFGK